MIENHGDQLIGYLNMNDQSIDCALIDLLHSNCYFPNSTLLENSNNLSTIDSHRKNIHKKKASAIFIGLLLLLHSGCSIQKTSEPKNGGTSTSPYALIIDQPDGTQIEVIGKGNMHSPYTETLDGYTILKNKERIYEYAIIGSTNELEPCGIKANNSEDRSKREMKFLSTIDKHLRNPIN